MNRMLVALAGLVLVLLGACRHDPRSISRAVENPAKIQAYSVTGIVTQLKGADSVVVRHEAVPNYMPAMTMPFKVKATNELAKIRPGQKIAFRLSVTADQSWIDGLRVLAEAPAATNAAPESAAQADSGGSDDYTFTNELGRRVNLADFAGQALGMTFIFTRCPVPDYCPRLSKNFEEASKKLLARPNTPANWRLLSFTIDPDFDTPGILKSYAQRHHYDSNHWSFLTGPKDRLAKLQQMFGFEAKQEGGGISHSFRTVIINTSNQVQQIFPFAGDFSDSIAQEMLKAMGATNTAAP